MALREMERKAEGIREAAVRAGADQAECIVRQVHSLRIEVRHGRPDGVQRRAETGAALRVLVDGREGLVFTTNPRSAEYGLLARDALDAARLLPSQKENRFSEADVPGSTEGLLDGAGLALPYDAKVLLAAQLEDAALGYDGKVQQTHKPSFYEHRRATAIASGGHLWSFEDTAFSLSVQAVSRHGGESQTGYEYRASRRLSDLDPELIGTAAARDAVGLLGGAEPRTGTYPALFPPKVALDLLGALVSSFSAEEMQKGRSRLKDRRGEKVFSSCLTVVDDGSLPWRLGTVPFDDERVPPVPRRLVEDGVVSGCLHNLKTSALWSEEPTGNGFRGSLASTPVPGPSNLFILQGPDPIDSLLPGSTTIRFSGLMGAHTIDRVSGDFSLGASGYILEGGEVTRPFRNGAVSGNLFDLMARLAAVGDDLTFYGSLGSPSLLFDKVILSGA